MWIYSQSSGQLWHTVDYRKVCTGYAGCGEGKNNPDLEAKEDVGPIPRGFYQIADPRDSSNTGPHVLDLEPIGHQAKWRTAFQIHGDSISNPGEASNGCIVMPRNVREQISGSGDSILMVIE